MLTSEAGGVVEEGPGDVEFFGEVLGEGLNAEGFGGVVAAVVDVEAEFFGEGIGPVATFAGDEGIDSFGVRFLEFVPCPAGDDSNFLNFCGAARDGFGRGAEGAGEAGFEFGAGECGAELEADGLAILVEEKWFGILESERGGELGVVAELRVGIEREVGAVDGEVVFEEEFEEGVAFAGPGMGGAPEEAVVNDEEIGAGGDGFLDGGGGGVDGGGDFGDGAVVLNLEAVDGAGVIGEFGGAEVAVAMGDDGMKRGGNGGGRGGCAGDGRGSTFHLGRM
jgi:hypothetical protein